MNEYVSKLFSLENKSVIVSGASRGIGFEIANALSKAGATVIGLSRSKQPVNNNAHFEFKQCDIANGELFTKICSDVASNQGTIDVLINAAGISMPSGKNVGELERFYKTVEINLLSAYNCCEICSGYMINGGSIVNITSIGSLLGFPGNPGYVASKGGLALMTKSLAIDYAEKNIRVNNIAPGYIHTDMTGQSFKDPELNKQRLDRMILNRWGEPGDLAGAAIFLASDASEYVTGIDLVVDGGWTAKGL